MRKLFSNRLRKESAKSLFECKVFYFTLEGEFLRQEYTETTASSDIAKFIDKEPVKFWSTEYGGFIYLYTSSDLNRTKEEVRDMILNRNILYFYSLSNAGFKLEAVRDTASFFDRLIMKSKLRKYRVLYDFIDSRKDVGFINKKCYEDESKIYIVMDRRDDKFAKDMLTKVYIKELSELVSDLQNQLTTHKAMLNEGIKDEGNESVVIPVNTRIEQDENIVITDSIDPHSDDGLDESDTTWNKVIDVTEFSPEDNGPFEKWDLGTKIKHFFNRFFEVPEVIDEPPRKQR